MPIHSDLTSNFSREAKIDNLTIRFRAELTQSRKEDSRMDSLLHLDWWPSLCPVSCLHCQACLFIVFFNVTLFTGFELNSHRFSGDFPLSSRPWPRPPCDQPRPKGRALGHYLSILIGSYHSHICCHNCLVGLSPCLTGIGGLFFRLVLGRLWLSTSHPMIFNKNFVRTFPEWLEHTCCWFVDLHRFRLRTFRRLSLWLSLILQTTKNQSGVSRNQLHASQNGSGQLRCSQGKACESAEKFQFDKIPVDFRHCTESVSAFYTHNEHNQSRMQTYVRKQTSSPFSVKDVSRGTFTDVGWRRIGFVWMFPFSQQGHLHLSHLFVHAL